MKKVDTFSQILTSAKELFSEKGYTDTTTKEIAKRAGVNEVTIFRKFGSKQKLFEAVFEHFNYNQNINIDINEYKDKPKLFLIDLGKSLYNLFKSNLSLIKIEFKNQTMLDGSVLPLQKFPNKIKKLMKNYFNENDTDMTDEEIELFSTNFLSTIFGLFININISHAFNPAPDFDKCIEALVDNLLK